MSAHLTEEQQLEALKEWWKEYGWSIVLGVVIAISVGFGWRFYQRYETQKTNHASLIYMHVMADAAEGNVQGARRQANVLRNHFARTPYAVLASFLLAQEAVQKNKLDDAVEYLQWAADHAHVATFKDMAKIRLARIYLAQHQPKKALALLDTRKDDAFAGLMAEVQGDVYVEMQDLTKARASYVLALKKLSEDAVTRHLLEMKLNDLSLPDGASS